MKWAEIRWAASTVVTTLSGFHHQVWGTWAMRCGSNTQQVPHSARPVWVSAHKSTLLLVATTAPGADKTCGAARLLVFPDRGAISTTMTSSHEAARSGPVGRNRPRGTPASSGAMVLAPVREGRSWRALATTAAGQSGA